MELICMLQQLIEYFHFRKCDLQMCFIHTEDFNASDLKHHLRRVDLAHVAPLVLLSHAQDTQRPSSVG